MQLYERSIFEETTRGHAYASVAWSFLVFFANKISSIRLISQHCMRNCKKRKTKDD